MATPLRQVQPALAFAARHLDEDLSLAALADHAGFSPFHLHRLFAAAVGETPKQLTLRLRLGRAAVLLLEGGETVLDIALACGFRSHEVFCRAFRRRFGITPSAYRARGFAPGADARNHATLVASIGPCVGLYRTNEIWRNEMAYSITTKEIAAQPVLLVRRRVKRSEIAKMIGESLPLVFLHAQKTGAALAGLPFARYLDWGPGMTTMEAGMRVSSRGPPPAKAMFWRRRCRAGSWRQRSTKGRMISSLRPTPRSSNGSKNKASRRRAHPGSPI